MLCVTYFLIVPLCSGVSNHCPNLHSPYTVYIVLIENNSSDRFKPVLFSLSKTNTPHLRKKVRIVRFFLFFFI